MPLDPARQLSAARADAAVDHPVDRGGNWRRRRGRKTRRAGGHSVRDAGPAVTGGARKSEPETPSPAVVVPARDLQAFEYYSRGRRLWQRLEKGTFAQAGELYEKAIQVEPNYALALSGLAALHAMRFTFTTDDGDLEKAADYARPRDRGGPPTGGSARVARICADAMEPDGRGAGGGTEGRRTRSLQRLSSLFRRHHLPVPRPPDEALPLLQQATKRRAATRFRLACAGFGAPGARQPE